MPGRAAPEQANPRGEPGKRLSNLAALVLAAGSAERFGSCKQLATYQGKPLLHYTLDALYPVFGESIFVVLGARCEQIAPEIAQRAHMIEHQDWRQGIGSSVSQGVGALKTQGTWQGVLIALGDQPAINTVHYQTLVDAFNGTNLVAAHYLGTPGVPAIFPAASFAELELLKGETGAKKILMTADNLTSIDMPEAQHDIDYREDLRVLNQH